MFRDYFKFGAQAHKEDKKNKPDKQPDLGRRKALKILAVGAGALAGELMVPQAVRAELDKKQNPETGKEQAGPIAVGVEIQGATINTGVIKWEVQSFVGQWADANKRVPKKELPTLYLDFTALQIQEHISPSAQAARQSEDNAIAQEGEAIVLQTERSAGISTNTTAGRMADLGMRIFKGAAEKKAKEQAHKVVGQVKGIATLMYTASENKTAEQKPAGAVFDYVHEGQEFVFTGLHAAGISLPLRKKAKFVGFPGSNEMKDFLAEVLVSESIAQAKEAQGRTIALAENLVNLANNATDIRKVRPKPGAPEVQPVADSEKTGKREGYVWNVRLQKYVPVGGEQESKPVVAEQAPAVVKSAPKVKPAEDPLQAKLRERLARRKK